jgi:hypothetical protein
LPFLEYVERYHQLASLNIEDGIDVRREFLTNANYRRIYDHFRARPHHIHIRIHIGDVELQPSIETQAQLISGTHMLIHVDTSARIHDHRYLDAFRCSFRHFPAVVIGRGSVLRYACNYNDGIGQ